jgi:hypothetical protein
MKTVSPTGLRNNFAHRFPSTRSDEEIVIVTRRESPARIFPIAMSIPGDEPDPVAADVSKLPVKPVAMPGPNLSAERAVRAILEKCEGSL